MRDTSLAAAPIPQSTGASMKTGAAVFVVSLIAAAGSAAVGSEGAGAGASEPPEGRPWTISASAYGFFVPDAPDFIMAIVPFDAGRLHVEGRYNYEALRSASGFVGLNARWGR